MILAIVLPCRKLQFAVVYLFFSPNKLLLVDNSGAISTKSLKYQRITIFIT